MQKTKVFKLLVIGLTFLVLFCSNSITVYANETNKPEYEIIIKDNAAVLTDEQEASLIPYMEPLLEYGNVGLVTYRRAKNMSINTKSRLLYKQYFANESGFMLIYDLDNGDVDIYCRGDVSSVITPPRRNDLTSEIHNRKEGNDFVNGSIIIFQKAYNMLDRELVFTPMRYATAIFLGISLSFIIAILIVLSQRINAHDIVDISLNKENFSVTRDFVFINQNRKERKKKENKDMHENEDDAEEPVYTENAKTTDTDNSEKADSKTFDDDYGEVPKPKTPGIQVDLL